MPKKEKNDTITIETDDAKVTIETDGDVTTDDEQSENPVRRAGESGQTFMARCMLSSTMVVQFPDQRQRNDACDRILNGEVTKNMNIIKNIIRNFTIRREEREGSQFIVVPIIALIEGVHTGSHGPTFYPASEIQRTAGDWNGVPLTVPHPEDFGGSPISALNPEVLKNFSVGTFENVVFENGKLKGEGWISLDRIEEIAPEVLHIIQEGVPLEVSTGLFTTSDNESGNFRGEEFDTTVSDFVPDHLALLPNSEGACSFVDGCGVRNNEAKCKTCEFNNMEGGEENVLKIWRNITFKDLQAMSKDSLKEFKESCFIFNWTLTTNELSHSKVREQLIGLVNDMDKPGAMHFLREVFNSHFIFEKIEENDRKLFSQKFSIKEDDIKIKGNAEEVKEKIEFIPVDNVSKREVTMDRKKLVDALIANEKNPYEEDDREDLMAMEDVKFNKFVEFVDCKCKEMETNEKKKEETPEPTVNEETKTSKKEEEEKTAVTTNEKKEEKKITVEDLPKELQTMLDRNMRSYKKESEFLIANLIKLPRNTLSKEELEEMGVDRLEQLCALAKIPTYIGNMAPDNQLLIKKDDEKGAPEMPSYIKLVENKGKMEDGSQLQMK